MARYRVVSKYLLAHSEEAARMLAPSYKQATAISGYNQGMVLPESVPADEIERFLAANLIEPVGE